MHEQRGVWMAALALGACVAGQDDGAIPSAPDVGDVPCCQGEVGEEADPHDGDAPSARDAAPPLASGDAGDEIGSPEAGSPGTVASDDAGGVESDAGGDEDARVGDAAPDAHTAPPDTGSPTDEEDPEAPPSPALDVAAATTDFLCVLAGTGDVRAPGQEAIGYLGTDLGFSYRHGDDVRFLFGDTLTGFSGAGIDPAVPSDDAFASISLPTYPDGDAVALACADGGLPLTFQTHADGQVAALDAEFPLDGFKVPLTGFSSGSDEYAIFFLSKPQACQRDADCGELVCDVGLGWALKGSPNYTDTGFTFACSDDDLLCQRDTLRDEDGRLVPDSGFCVDPDASTSGSDGQGRLSAVAIQMRVGVRDPEAPSRFAPWQPWLTTRFQNVTATVGPLGTEFDSSNKVLLFGRPQFVGVADTGRSAHLHFAYVDMPQSADGDRGFAWEPHYFTHVDEDGTPHFSERQRDAAALDLSGGLGNPDETVDVVNQMSVRYVPELDRWLMLYGGGLSTLPRLNGTTCGVLEVFAGEECERVDQGDGSIYLRTAERPWGPWSAPEKILVGGDPEASDLAGTQYVPGGLLRHPDCREPGCAPHDPYLLYNPGEYGTLYGANIVDDWARIHDGSLELYWNVSSWDPYRVALMRTRLPVQR